jgi:hypothetical protein
MSSPQPQMVAQQMTAEAPARISSEQPVRRQASYLAFPTRTAYLKKHQKKLPICNHGIYTDVTIIFMNEYPTDVSFHLASR